MSIEGAIAVMAGISMGLIFAFFLLKLQSDKSTKTDSIFIQQQIEAIGQQLYSSLNETQRTVREELHLVRSQMDNNLTDTHHIVGQRLDNNNRVMGELQQSLGKLSGATEYVIEIGKDISSLQDLLRPPKLRGSLGELLLAELLGQVLTYGQYSLQHSFKNGEMVDAVIHLNAGLVPVDSKFPLDNFERLVASSSEDERKINRRRFSSDVRKHIDAISHKYIRPDEGTFDFALMYVPAENVYYETIIKEDNLGNDSAIHSYALTKRVIPVSPNSFYAYLQAIALGLKGMRIERTAHEILGQLSSLNSELEQIESDYDTLGLHLGNATKKYAEIEKRLSRFEDKLKALGAEPVSHVVQKESSLASLATRPTIDGDN
ncbi:MAG: DNA recombination protein RmuC [Chloroflexota bacterium]|nr:DNA recombination protein RmuC [Chloroflexota bacterium]